MKRINYIEAITEGMREEMARDERVILFGEDIAAYGGVFKATKGLYEEFGPERVMDSPLAESLIIGACVGAAAVGMRPMPEIQFSDFITCGFDQIIQQVAKLRYRSGGNWTCPLTIRCPYGGAVGGGLYHSQTNEAWFAHTPGLVVVAPATPYDAKGLLKAAVRSDDPVLYFEHKKLYRTITQEIPEDDFTVPLGKAEVKREGDDVTVFAYSLMLHRVLEAAEELEKDGISTHVVDLRTLNPLDKEAILGAAEKTGKIIAVHESNKTLGVAAEISAIIMEEGFDFLDAPVKRVCGPDVPQVPFAPPLEEYFMPSTGRIKKAIRDMAMY